MAGARILAVWQYSRTSWVAPIERLADEFGFHVTYLAHRDPDEESEVVIPPDRARVYWTDFTSAASLLDALDPGAVVLMGTDGLWVGSLVAAARRRRVPTLHLQHGIDVPQGRVGRVGAFRVLSRLPAVRFAAGTVLTDPSLLPSVAGPLVLGRGPADLGRRLLAGRDAHGPDLHLLSGRMSAERLLNARPDVAGRVRLVGLPEHDDLYAIADDESGSRNVLLIDTPHTGGPHNPRIISPAEKASILRRLAEDLATVGWRLTVKLHPVSYRDGWIEDLGDAAVVRDAPIAPLLASAGLVMGFDSSLLIPAMARRPVIIVRPTADASWFVDAAMRAGLPVIDGYRALTADAVLAASAEDDAGRRRALLERLTAATDGRGLERVVMELDRAMTSARSSAQPTDPCQPSDHGDEPGSTDEDAEAEHPGLEPSVETGERELGLTEIPSDER